MIHAFRNETVSFMSILSIPVSEFISILPLSLSIPVSEFMSILFLSQLPSSGQNRTEQNIKKKSMKYYLVNVYSYLFSFS